MNSDDRDPKNPPGESTNDPSFEEIEIDVLREVIGGLGSGAEGANLGWGRIDCEWQRG
jgi:hypothetical protein